MTQIDDRSKRPEDSLESPSTSALPEADKSSTPFNPDTFSIPKNEIQESFARSGGPGGQNVNKLNTKVVVKWNIDASSVLTAKQKLKLKSDRNISRRVDSEGNLLVQDASSRKQLTNRRSAIAKLEDLVKNALKEKKKRKKTRPTRASKEKRLKDKKANSQRKRNRKSQDDW